MGLLIGSMDIGRSEVSLEELGCMFVRYETLVNKSSVEGLGKLASNIAIGFNDFVRKVVMNVNVELHGILKNIKRSELKALIDGNALGMRRVMSAGYVDLKDIECPNFPFSVSPREMSAFFQVNFKALNMIQTMGHIINEYHYLAAVIRLGNVDKIKSSLAKIESLNMASYLTIKNDLIKLVAKPDGTNHTVFGNIFSSVSEFDEAIKNTLADEKELNNAIDIAKLIESLYGAFETLKDNVSHATTTGLDFSKINNITTVIDHTGNLIEEYSMLVSEYHHLEHWLSTTTKNLLSTMKK